MCVQAFSPVGRCKTFDVSADGYGRGEGCAAIVMKPQENGEPASNSLAVLKASATNQDGRSSSLTAPNGPSQAALIRTAMSLAGDPLHCLLQSPYPCAHVDSCACLRKDKHSWGGHLNTTEHGLQLTSRCHHSCATCLAHNFSRSQSLSSDYTKICISVFPLPFCQV